MNYSIIYLFNRYTIFLYQFILVFFFSFFFPSPLIIVTLEFFLSLALLDILFDFWVSILTQFSKINEIRTDVNHG